MSRFRNRQDAGVALGAAVSALGLDDPVVLGLPRGGVAVAVEVARALDAPLDVVVVRKVGPPGNPELGVGAVGEDRVEVLEEPMLAQLGLTRADVADAIRTEQREVERRVLQYRGARPAVPLAGRSAVVVDDGLATGVSVQAALRVLREHDLARLVLALPVAASQGLARVSSGADEVVCLEPSDHLRAVGLWYDDFDQVSDEQVQRMLAELA